MLYTLTQKPVDKPEIYMYQSGRARFDHEWKYSSLTGNSFTRLYYIKKGHGFLVCSGETIPMVEGNCYLIPSGTGFSYECTKGEEIEKLYYHFSVPTFEDYDLFARVNGIFSMPISDIKAERIFDCFEKKHYQDIFLEKTILHQTVAAFFEKCNIDKTPMQTYSETVLKTINFIRENLSVKLETKYIAQKLFISESTIRKFFKAETGKTIGNYIDELIFLEAKRMLLKKIPIKDISTKLGFCDQFYFSRRFKEKYSITPSQYRRDSFI